MMSGASSASFKGVTLHEFVKSSLYGVALSDERKGESHIREAERMLDRLLAIEFLADGLKGIARAHAICCCEAFFFAQKAHQQVLRTDVLM